MLVLPAFILLAFLASIGLALWATALNVKYRDFRFVTPFIVQFGLYISPVGPHPGRVAAALLSKPNGGCHRWPFAGAFSAARVRSICPIWP